MAAAHTGAPKTGLDLAAAVILVLVGDLPMALVRPEDGALLMLQLAEHLHDPRVQRNATPISILGVLERRMAPGQVDVGPVEGERLTHPPRPGREER